MARLWWHASNRLIHAPVQTLRGAPARDDADAGDVVDAVEVKLIYIYIYVYIHICISLYLSLSLYIYIYTYIHIYIYIYIYTHTHICKFPRRGPLAVWRGLGRRYGKFSNVCNIHINKLYLVKQKYILQSFIIL